MKIHAFKIGQEDSNAFQSGFYYSGCWKTIKRFRLGRIQRTKMDIGRQYQVHICVKTIKEICGLRPIERDITNITELNGIFIKATNDVKTDVW